MNVIRPEMLLKNEADRVQDSSSFELAAGSVRLAEMDGIK
jgi:hypothetical protein